MIAAFRDVTGDGALGEIATHRIVGQAEVTWSDFHGQFSGIHDLAAAALIAEFDVVATMDFTSRLEFKATGAEASEESLVHLIQFIDERRSLYKGLFGRADGISRSIEDAFTANALDALRAGGAAAEHQEVAARLMATGVLGVIDWWLREEPDLGIRDLAAAMRRAIPPDFTR